MREYILVSTKPKKTKMETSQIKLGSKIKVQIYKEVIEATVVGFGTHKGRPVLDLTDKDGNGRFAYYSQVIE